MQSNGRAQVLEGAVEVAGPDTRGLRAAKIVEGFEAIDDVIVQRGIAELVRKTRRIVRPGLLAELESCQLVNSLNRPEFCGDSDYWDAASSAGGA